MTECFYLSGDVLRKMASFKVLLTKGEDGYFVAECPQLPGCISQGSTREQAIANIREAIALCVEEIRSSDVEFVDVKVAV